MSVEEKLRIREWFAVFFFLTLFLTMGIVNFLSIISIDPKHLPKSVVKKEKPYVYVEGYVKYPGKYFFDKGDKLKDILLKAHTLPLADIKRYKLERSLKKGEVIKVRKQPTIVVFVKGAVEKPGKYEIPKNTKKKELLKYIKVDKNAKIKALNSSKKLKDQEVIWIPYKKR